MCMNELKDVLDQLAKKYHIEFWAIYNIEARGRWNKNLPKVCPVKHIQWTENIYSILSKADIGVAPTIFPINKKICKLAKITFKNYFFYLKCDLLLRFKYSTNSPRVYVFSQFYLPTVADFTPSCCQLIQHGKSGFLPG